MCGEWNTMEEFRVPSAHDPVPRALGDVKPHDAEKLADIETGNEKRMPLGMPEVDRTLGGGLVPGSVVLFGGEPGIGKSTLVLQMCHALSSAGKKVLYASGEESEKQIKLRAERLHMGSDECLILSTSHLESIVDEIDKHHPDFLVVDSIQTVFLETQDSPLGSPGQIRAATALLVRLAKERDMAVLIIGHVTKEGNLAGPRMLEHMVDVVLYLEGDRSYQFRVLRTVKNRFGSTSETGLFTMEKDGLMGIRDASRFLVRDQSMPEAGQVVTACMEGQRAILVEIQALSVYSVLQIPRRISVGMDYNRLIVLLAVLEKKAGVPFSSSDVYVNVSNGFRVNEPAADLPAALAIVSAERDVPVPAGTISMGEISLTGEILPVSHVLQRIREARRMQFHTYIIPEGNRREIEKAEDPALKDCHFIFVSRLSDVVRLIKQKKRPVKNR
jgi:DNA repair protein RadA/Sms